MDTFAYYFFAGLIVAFGLTAGSVQAQNNEGQIDGQIDQVSGGADAECSAVANEEGLGPLQGLAKYEADQGSFEFNDGNVSFGSDPPKASSGTWSSDVPVKAFLLKQATTIYYWTFGSGTNGSGTKTFTYNSPVSDVSHFTFCAKKDFCRASSFEETVVRSTPPGKVKLEINDPNGIEKVDFYELNNFTVESEDFEDPDDDNVWTPTSSGATSGEFTLTQLDPDEPDASYFVKITNGCGTTTNIDPQVTFDVVVPDQFDLAGNHPNPFDERTTIEFSLTKQRRVTLSIYNVMGQKVATLLDDKRTAGPHSITWRGRSDSGRELPSGVYFIHLRTGAQSVTQRVTLVQ